MFAPCGSTSILSRLGQGGAQAAQADCADARPRGAEDEIAKLDRRYQRNIVTSNDTRAEVQNRILKSTAQPSKFHYPATDDDLTSLIGQPSNMAIEERMKQDP